MGCFLDKIWCSYCEMGKKQSWQGRLCHWRLCEKHGLEGAIQKYDHEPDGIIERKVCKTLLDFTIQCNIKTEAQ